MVTELNNPAILQELPSINAGSGMTFAVVFRADPAKNGVFLYQKDHFVFAQEKRKLYANFMSPDGSWASYIVSKDVILADDKFHHAALVINHHLVGSQGEDWTDAKLYYDGVPVCGIRYDKVHPVPSDHPLIIGKGKSLSGEVEFTGKIAKLQIFDKLFSENEIRELVINENDVTPGFKVFQPLTAEDEALLKKETDPVIRNARRTISQGNYSLIFDWKNVKLEKLDSKESALVIASDENHAIPVSWYDLKTERELLSPCNHWYKFSIRKGEEKHVFEPFSDKLKSFFVKKPVADADGKWSFDIAFDSTATPDFSGETHWTFANDRIEFDLNVQDKTEGFLVREINFPLVTAAVLDHGTDYLVAPQMSGVEMPDAVKRNASFTSPYPRGNCSLQMGAYYDNDSGIYCGVGDPVARSKEFNFCAGNSGCEFSYDWNTPYDIDRKPNRYESRSLARIELFRGNWFEAGQIYRSQLKDSGAWWFVDRSDDPADHPQWMWENTLWLRMDLAYHQMATISPTLKRLRKYLGLPLALHVYDWYEKGSWLSPMVRPSPAFIEDAADLRKHDIRTVPYTTARIWQNPDRRGKDYLYEKVAFPNTVIEENGNPAIERYGRLPCSVLCPHTPAYMKYEFDMTVQLAALGMDGIYADQIGAARPRPCFSEKHGHRLGEDNWFSLGQYPVYKKIRDYWRENAPDMVLTTEDNAEHCVALFHGLLNWRWMLDGQIPLFTEVYAGHTQFIGLDGVGEEPEAAFPKAATQFTNGEQLGWFQHHKITSPVRGEFRKFIKMLMHLRFALLDFYNLGDMSKPVVLTPQPPKIPRFWGRQGTYYVSTAAVQSSSWHYNGVEITLLVNNTAETRSGNVKLKQFDNERILQTWCVDGVCVESIYPDKEITYSLAPRAAVLYLSFPADNRPLQLIDRVKNAFDVIKAIPEENDPFAINQDSLPVTEPFRADQWQKEPLPIGELSSEMSYEVSAFGTVKLDGAVEVEAVFNARIEHPVGSVTMRINSLDDANTLAEFDVQGAYPPGTSSIGKKTIRIPLKKKYTGNHQLFFLLSECSHCELDSWRLIYDQD